MKQIINSNTSPPQVFLRQAAIYSITVKVVFL